MESRSCEPTPEPSRVHVYTSARPPRPGVAVRDRRFLVTVDVVKGSSGFGFTLADTGHGQVIKDVVDSERCRHVFPGDLLVAINDITVRDWAHDDVVSVLRSCRARRVARLTLMTSRGEGSGRHDQPRRGTAAVPPRSTSAMAEPLQIVNGHTEHERHVDYNQLYRKLYTPVPFVSEEARSPAMRRSAPASQLMSSHGAPDNVLMAAGPDVVGNSPASPRLTPVARRREPRRSLPTQPATSPIMPRRVSRESSQTSLNFSGTPDFIPASAYLDDDDRRRRVTGRPTVDNAVAGLTLNDATDDVFRSSAVKTPPVTARRVVFDDYSNSYDADDASLPSSGSFRNCNAAGLPVTSPTTSGNHHDRRTPAGFVGGGSETCNGYNTKTEALHSAAPARHQPPAGHHSHHRSHSAMADAGELSRAAYREPVGRLSSDGVYDRPPPVTTAGKAGFYPAGSLDRRGNKGYSPARRVLVTEAVPNAQDTFAVSSSSAPVSGSDQPPAVDQARTSSTSLYEVELHRGSRGFGFAIRGGREFAGVPICVLNIARGGSADMDGRLRNADEIVSINGVSTESLTHSDAVQLVQNSSSPLHLLMRHTTQGRMQVRSPRMSSPIRAAPAPIASAAPVYRRPTNGEVLEPS